MSDSYYRAELHLSQMRRVVNDAGTYARDEAIRKVATVEVTGDSEAEALAQMERHVSELAEWHTQRERDAEPPPMSVECRHKACDGCDGTASEPGSPPCEHHCHKIARMERLARNGR
ncbi:hypothetical protein AB0N38_14070 [Micromonospora aurantiaca]|uniref:hypothetical protein n=1 Tax=Micromonospora aurantiaca (nom. illeg.) TaxID=47850 RepID=UPI0034396D89